MSLALTPTEAAMVEGDDGLAVQMAINVIVGLARAANAEELVEVTSAHVGSDMPGESTLDWLRTLVALGASFRVPTTLNIASFDLLHPELFHGDAREGRLAREVMALTNQLGGRRTWTCAPYLLDDRPSVGENVAWSESGAVVFANSVLGARCDRGGIFTDMCAALTGRVPASGLHLDENRLARVVVDVTVLPPDWLADDLTYHLLGYWIGKSSEGRIPALVGLPSSTAEHRLQVMSAAIATSSGLGMFHVVGRTPEAETLEQAVGGRSDDVARLRVTKQDLVGIRRDLTLVTGDDLQAVCLGTPHYSVEQFEELLRLIDAEGERVDRNAPFYVNTNRHVMATLTERGWLQALDDRGVSLVTDTCTYLAPLLSPSIRTVMTNSAKWAFYGAPQRGVSVVLGSTAECVRSAIEGKVRHDDIMWS